MKRLITSEKQLKEIIETIPQLVWRADQHGQIDYVSERFASFMGASEAELKGEGWIDFIHPDDQAAVKAELARAIESLTAFKIQFRVKPKHQDDYLWVDGEANPLKDKEGSLLNFFGTLSNINDAKVEEEKRLVSESRYEYATRATKDAIWDWNLQTNKVRWNKAIVTVFGYEDSAQDSDVQWWYEHIHPEDRERVVAGIHNVIDSKDGEHWEDQYRFLRADGTPAYIFDKGFVVRDEQSLPQRMIGAMEDITIRRAKEKELSERELQYRSVFESTNDGIMIFDQNGKLVEVNPAACRMHGYSKDEMIGMSGIQFVHPQDVSEFTRFVKEVNEGKTFTVTARHLKKTGEVINIDVAGSDFLYGEEECLLAIVRDITERKAAESALAELGQRFNRMTKSTGFGVWYCDLPFDELIWDHQVKEHFFIPPEDKVTIDDFYARIVPEDRERTQNAINTSIEKQTNYNIVYRTFNPENPDDDIKYIQAIGWTDYDSEDNPIRFDGVTLDITQRQQYEIERLQMGAIVENSRDFVLICDKEFKPRLINPSGRQISGLDDQALNDYSFFDFFPASEKEFIQSTIIPKVEAKDFWKGQLYLKDIQTNKKIPVNLHMFRINDPLTNVFNSYACFIRDITEQKQYEKDLELAKEVAEKASESKTRFLANMSHEIRTPLSAVLGFSDLLQTRLSDDEEANMYINRITRNSLHLTDLIDDLLDLSKIESDKIELEKISVDLEAMLEDVKNMFTLKAREKNLKINFKWTTPEVKTIYSDAVRLTQVFTNIIGNAVKFTEKGEVNVLLAFEDGILKTLVSDTGIGISKTQQQKIFDPFVQADLSVSRKYGGTGLGLVLAKKLSQLLGGDLKLEESTLGAGTTFSFWVKSFDKNMHASGIDGLDDSSKAKELKDLRILVVDDSKDNRIIIRTYLRAVGIEVLEATNGREGVSVALENDCHMILMDIQMPVMDGYTALSELQKTNYDQPIVAFTAHAFSEEKSRCLEAGFSEYIVKPVDRNDLIEVIKQQCL
ncbi:MAG: hypothetical protein CME62_06035 [Halobacteriovoraceae bacterium]|nr:hypothetical protein [Halobacteriovoraceae bacterium]|tara:strand:- start:9546 stop:12593 length:3048 start_codon:yes stop_codon:yes gene_type:complete